MMSTGIQKKACVSDIAAIMEAIAPAFLAETWDNCGLQVGASQWPVDKIWVALDPLVEVIEAAGQHGVDLVITHHPLIFKSLKSIDLNSFEGKVIACALRSQTAVYAAHTNLDSTADGINDVLADRLGLMETEPLLAAAHYVAGDGDPTAPIGLGRIGTIASPMPVKEWARQLKKRLGLAHVKLAGNLDRAVHRAAVCSGSGSSLMDTFLSSDADVYVSGDLRYHDARSVEESGRAFIDIGHFASEHLIIEPLVRKLRAAVEAAGWDVAIEPCSIESDPFSIM